MGRAIDLFVTYRFIKLLVTPFEKTDAYKLAVIDKNGNRIMPPPTKGGVRQTKPASLFLHCDTYGQYTFLVEG